MPMVAGRSSPRQALRHCYNRVRVNTTLLRTPWNLVIMRRLAIPALALLLSVGCGQSTPSPTGGTSPRPGTDSTEAPSLTEARKEFKTKLVRKESGGEAPPAAPADLFRTVKYDGPAGKMSAYLSVAPKDGKKRPAIVWITGGDCNSIDEGCWKKQPASNDQSARAFREAGIVMMFPSLRGGNNNPGVKEGFLGEVDDVIAATDFLARQEFVNPERVYLGGHSTGGTLVMLVAACSDRYRAVFSFGPADDVSGYGPQFCPFDTSNPREVELRSPGRWVNTIKSPTFVFEGTVQGNLASLQAMSGSSTNPKVHFFPVKGANHFNLLDPTTRLIAAKILKDEGPTTSITFTADEVNRPFAR
jgi:acetyl esterase/lipase